MSLKTFHISGRVTHQQSQRSITNVRVEAWDKDLIFDELVGSAITDEHGHFNITFTEEHFQACFPDRQPDLFFKVFTQKNRLIVSTENSVLWNVNVEEIALLIEVDLPLPNIPKPEDKPSEQFVVKGTIRQVDNGLLVDAVVRAFDKDLRREQRLGEKRTNQAGYYEITYTRAQFCRSEKNSADLVVRVYDRTGDRLLTQSDIIFNAEPVEIVDLTVITEEDRLRSEYERLLAALRPILREQAITNLREDAEEKPAEGKYRDITFLAGETGFEKDILARLVMAHKLSQQAIQPEFWFALLGGSFYQYTETQNLDQQFATILDSLPSLDATAVHKALTRSFNQKETPEILRENMASWIEAFLQFIANQTVGESARPSFVKSALADAGIQGTEKQEKFARLYNQHKAITPELLGALEQDPSFTKPEIEALLD